MLKYCDKCKESSIVGKAYTNKAGQRKYVEFCLNKGCGYTFSHDIPLKRKENINEEENHHIKSGQE